MAGSLNHIINEDGRFWMDLIENLGDAHEVLEECFNIIYELANGDSKLIGNVCRKLGYLDPWENRYVDDHKEPMRVD